MNKALFNKAMALNQKYLKIFIKEEGIRNLFLLWITFILDNNPLKKNFNMIIVKPIQEFLLRFEKKNNL
jgi:hypothetical protein